MQPQLSSYVSGTVLNIINNLDALENLTINNKISSIGLNDSNQQAIITLDTYNKDIDALKIIYNATLKFIHAASSQTTDFTMNSGSNLVKITDNDIVQVQITKALV